MSEHQEQDDSRPVEAEDDAVEDAATDSDDASKQSAATGARRKSAGVVAWLALLLAVAAAGLAGQPYWQRWVGEESDRAAAPATPTAAEFRSLADRVESIDGAGRQAVQELRDGMADLEAELAAGLETETAPPPGLVQRLERLEARIERVQGEQNASLGAIRSRVEDLEEQVGRRLEQFDLRLDDVGLASDRAAGDLATRVRLVEVDSLFALAQDQLAVSASVDAARSAWQRGLERLAALEAPQFDDLKRTARREFEQLRAFDKPDTNARVDRIFAIVSDIDQWPAASGRAQPERASASSSTGWRRRLGSVFDELVTIESVDDQHLSQAEVDLERVQLRATLQSAALALVRADYAMARGLVEQALRSASRAFDTDSPRVEEAIAWLSDLAAQPGPGQRLPQLEDSRAEIARLLESLR